MLRATLAVALIAPGGRRMSPTFLKELSQARPDPGGGAAAAYGAVLGLALLKKVVRLEANRRHQGRPPDQYWGEIQARVDGLWQTLARLQEEDVRAYGRLARARASDSPEALAAAVREAVAVPRGIMEEAQEALGLISQVGGRCKKHLVSDLQVAVEFLGAAVAGAHHIAGANLALVEDPAQRQRLARELDQSLEAGARILTQVKGELQARGPNLAHCR